jgi:hypothetical protein
MYTQLFQDRRFFIFHIHLQCFIHLQCIFNVKEGISVFMKFVIFPIIASIKGHMMAPS